MSATISTPTADGVTGSTGRCDNADCSANKLIAMVPKRKTTQFVTEPSVMEKPMLINGFTTVFQVDGSSAKLGDLKNPNPNAPHEPKTIYRIVPNRHSHIVNYVVIDTDGESLRKINESDPATMRKLLDSQKVSADQMLQKLMAGHGTTTNIPTSNVQAAANAMAARGGGSILPPPQTPALLNTNMNKSSPASNMPIAANNAATPPPTAPPIQLPVRMHPNLKITAVASAETVAGMVPPPVSNVPLITPIPLANLQASSGIIPVPAAPMISAVPPPLQQAPSAETVEKPVFDKMQAELQELRRTVALLAEAQAKNQATVATNVTAAEGNPRLSGSGIAAKRSRT